MCQEMQSIRQDGSVMAGLVRPVLMSAVLFMVITGLGVSVGQTTVAELLFHYQAQGSIIRENGVGIGSEVIGQWLTRPQYFQPRPSATTGTDPKDPSKTIDQAYNAANSGGSNLGQLIAEVTRRAVPIGRKMASGRKLLPLSTR
jgi:potassium-transporting ATPase KdpC subunit